MTAICPFSVKTQKNEKNKVQKDYSKLDNTSTTGKRKINNKTINAKTVM